MPGPIDPFYGLQSLPGRRGAVPAGLSGGFTLLEVMTALIITAVATVTAFQAFAYGAVELQRLGYRRQALGLLDGEMEYWRARFQQVDAANPVSPAEAGGRARNVILDPDAAMAFKVETNISDLKSQPQGQLQYQTVRVSVSYRKVDLADTLVLEGPQYVR